VCLLVCLAVLEASRAAEKLLGAADEPVIGGGGVAQEFRTEAVRARPYQDSRGAIMIGGQRIQVGLPHAGKTAEITIESDTCQITVEDGITLTAPRTTSRDIRRHKASHYASHDRDDGQC
jgi:hypothetical protein